MKCVVWIAAVLVAFNFLGSRSASARDAVIMIKAAGEGYEGAPKLRLLANGRLIGERTLGKSFDTSSGKRLKTAANLKDYVEWLRFEVPAIEDVAKLEIDFNNEAWAGKGKPGNRALFVYGLFIDGYRFRPKVMNPVPAKSGGAWSGQAMLWANGRLQLARPEKGWRSGYKAATPSN